MKSWNFLSLGILAIALFSCQQKAENGGKSGVVVNRDSLALDSLSKEIRQTPEDASLFHERSKVYFKFKKYSDAINDAVLAIRLDSTKPEYFFTLSEFFLNQGVSSKSKETLEKCIRLHPENAQAHIKMADLFLIVKMYKDALASLSEAQRINPNIAEIYYLKGRVYREGEKADKAIENFQIAVNKNPEYYEAYILLGLLHAEAGDSLALDYYRNALKVKPLSFEAHYNMAYFYQEYGDVEKAIQTYHLILQDIDSLNKNIYFNLGYIQMEFKKDYRQAAKEYTKAINLDLNYAEAFLNRGFCFEMLGDFSRAAVDYNASLQIIPNYELAVQALNRLDKKRKLK